jgi:hypothetical protein
MLLNKSKSSFIIIDNVRQLINCRVTRHHVHTVNVAVDYGIASSLMPVRECGQVSVPTWLGKWAT